MDVWYFHLLFIHFINVLTLLKMKKFSLLAILLAMFALFTVSCSDDDNTPEKLPEPTVKVKAIIVNQGVFTKGNASLSTLLEDGTVNNDVFRQANNRPLGDVAQSMMYQNGKYFIVLNNSKKIEIVNADDFKSVETILFEEEVNPRYMVAINEREAVLSDMNKQLLRINTETYKVQATIPTENFAVEQMLCVGGKLFCTVPYGAASGIYVYNTSDLKTPAKIDATHTPYETASLVLDANNKIWALCYGYNDNYQKESIIYGIDPATTHVTDTIRMPDQISPSSYPRLAVNVKTNKLYFDGRQDNKNYAFEADPVNHTVKPYVELSGLGMTYGMNITSDGNILLADCLDYSGQRAYIREYRTDGSFFSYKVGIYPGFIHLTENNK